MKIAIQSKIGLSPEEVETIEKELGEKFDCKVIILQPTLSLESLTVVDN